MLFESGEDLRTVVDLQYTGYPRGIFVISSNPPRFKYNVDDVFTRIAVYEFGNRVFDRLMEFEQIRLLENLSTGRTGKDIVAEREKGMIDDESVIIVDGGIGVCD